MSTPAATAAEPAAPIVEPAPAAAAAPTLRGFLANLRTGATTGAELIAARAELAERDTQLAAANAQLFAAGAQFAAASAQLSTLSAFFGLPAAELVGKDTAALQALITEKINAAALDQVASMGVPAAALPPPAPDLPPAKSALSGIERVQAHLTAAHTATGKN
jgi:hypothetical protein